MKELFIIILIILTLYGLSYFYFEYYTQSPNKVDLKVKQLEKVEKFKEKQASVSVPKIYQSPNGIEKVENNRELYELYFKGVPDTFDVSGIRIPGVEPNAQKAIHYLEQLIRSPQGTKKDVLNLAKLYHQGMHKFEPDLDKAEEIYSSLSIDKDLDEDIWQQVMEGLKDIHNIRVYKWLNLPLPGSEDEEIDNTMPGSLTGDVMVDNETFNLNQIIQAQEAYDQQRMLERQQAIAAGLEIEGERGTKEYDDPQNTHDSQVLSTIRASLNKLRESPQTKDSESCLREIRVFLQSLPNNDKRKAAEESLRRMTNSKEILANAGGITEVEAISLVWNRINDPGRFDLETKRNLKETMFEELASMQEHGETVCPTGRLTRIVDTLNGVDEEVSIKPTYAINEEMMLKSSAIRERLLQEYPEHDRDQYEAGTHRLQEKFDEELKETIIGELKKDYVDTKILTQGKFNTEIKKWIDYI